MSYGYYPTISDMVLTARLYQNDGKHGDQQILYAPRIRELLAGPNPRGFPTGDKAAIRLAKSGQTADNSKVDTSGMTQVANSLSRFRH